jgi:hypothetical protein
VSISLIGKSYAEIIHKEVEEERKLKMDQKKAQEANLKAEKKLQAAKDHEKKLTAEYIDGIHDVDHPGYENWFMSKEVEESNKPSAEELKRQADEKEENYRQKKQANGINF